MSKGTDRLKDIALLGATLLVALAIGELALRAVKPQLTYSKLVQLAGTYYAPSDYNTFQLKANYQGTEPSMEHPGEYVKITTDENRFRGGHTLDPGKRKIVVLGDSYTFGVYVGDDETYPAVLNKRIATLSDKYQVINAGYTGGWETDQQYVWLKHNITRLHPSLVVLGIFVGNDITGIDPTSWVNTDDKGLPDNWISKDLYVTEAGYIRNKNKGLTTVGTESIYRVPVLRESHLAILIGKAWDKIADKLENREASLVGESFDHIYGNYNEEFLRKEAIFLRLIRAMRDLAQDHGSEFVVALLPMNVMVEKEKFDLSATYGVSALPKQFRNADSVYYARLGKLLEKSGIPAIDIESAMKHSKEGPFFPANGEVHFNANGHRFVAEQVFKFLKSHQLIDAPLRSIGLAVPGSPARDP